MSTPILIARDLHKSFGATPALAIESVAGRGPNVVGVLTTLITQELPGPITRGEAEMQVEPLAN